MGPQPFALLPLYFISQNDHLLLQWLPLLGSRGLIQVDLFLPIILFLPQIHWPLCKTCTFLMVLWSVSHWRRLRWSWLSSMFSLISSITSMVSFHSIISFIFFILYSSKFEGCDNTLPGFWGLCEFWSLVVAFLASCFQCNSFATVRQIVDVPEIWPPRFYHLALICSTRL